MGHFWSRSPLFLFAAVCLAAAPLRAADPITEEATGIYQANWERGNFKSAMEGADQGKFSWFGWTCMNAELMMYQVTGEKVHIDRVLDWGERFMANRSDRRGLRDDYRGRIVKSWVGNDYTFGLNYAEGSSTGLLCHPMAEAVYWVYADESLRAEYGERAAVLLREVIDTMEEFDADFRDGPGVGEGHYYNQYNDVTYGQPQEPLNLQNAIGRTLVDLYLVTGEEKYRQRAEKLARFMKNLMRPVEDHVVWPYSTYRLRYESDHVEDFSHAGLNVMFAFECYRAGIVFNEEDMRRMANTLKWMYRGPEVGYADRLNGEGTERSLGVSSRWLVLGFFDERVRRNELEHLRHLAENYGASRSVAAAATLAYSGTAFNKLRPLNIKPVPPRSEPRELEPLFVAAGAGDVSALRALVDGGATLREADAWGRTALHHAAEAGHDEAVRFLLGAGADIERRDKRLYTAMHAAAEAGRTRVVATLIESGAPLDAVELFNRSALHLAANQGHADTVAALLAAGADFKLESTGGSPIHGAAIGGHLAVVGLLLDAGEEINRLDPRYQATPLYLAATYSRPEVAAYLLDRGADLTLKMKHGRSPMDIAVIHGDVAMARLLVEHGADPLAVDRFGMPLPQRAELDGHAELAAVLRSYHPATP